MRRKQRQKATQRSLTATLPVWIFTIDEIETLLLIISFELSLIITFYYFIRPIYEIFSFLFVSFLFVLI